TKTLLVRCGERERRDLTYQRRSHTALRCSAPPARKTARSNMEGYLKKLAKVMLGADEHFPPPNAP
ncbi:MAG: hypothetical protein WCD33_21430, partial [Mycobacterium sp.]